MYKHVTTIDTEPFGDWLSGNEPLTWKPDSGYLIFTISQTDTDAARDVLRDILPPGEWKSARLIAIKPNGIIHRHTDPIPDGRGAATRYHVVLATNPYCWNYHDGDIQRLEHGGVYTIDEKLEHASVNWGATARIHLVIDVGT